jgi:hypothetical protein
VTLQEALLAAILAEPSSDEVSEEELKKIATLQGYGNDLTILQSASAGTND